MKVGPDDENLAIVDKTATEFTLNAAGLSVINWAVIIHSGDGDLGSERAGDSGNRVACEVIGCPSGAAIPEANQGD